MSTSSRGDRLPVIAVLGGTGSLGAAIAKRLSIAGYDVVLGSRDVAKARRAAAIVALHSSRAVTGEENSAAAAHGDIVIVAVPYAIRRELLIQIRANVQNKIVVDTTVPAVPPKITRVQLPPAGSAAVEMQDLLGSSVKVVSAFHNIAAHKLAADEKIDCDVLVFGDDKGARAAIMELVSACGLRSFHGGSLANSVATEALTCVLMFINRVYSVDGAGIRITGMPSETGS